MDNRGDEIGELAARLLLESDAHGLELINAHVAAACAANDWDAMNKWHRVRLRLIRLQQRRATAGRLDPPGESPARQIA